MAGYGLGTGHGRRSLLALCGAVVLALAAMTFGASGASAAGLSIEPIVSPVTATSSPTVTGSDEPEGSGYGEITLTVRDGLIVAYGPVTFAQDNAGPGAWQQTVGPLLNGTYTLEVTQTNGTSPLEATETFSIEVPPSGTSISGFPPNPDGSGEATFTFGEATSNAPGAVSYECSLDGGPYAACTSPQTLSVAEGAHIFSVRSRDSEGLVESPAQSYTWEVDMTAPVESITTPTEGQAFTLDENVPASFSCTDPVSAGVSSGVASCVGEVYYDGAATPTATVQNGEALPTEQDGPYELIVTGTDNVGNSSSSQPVYYHVDPANYETFTLGLNPLAFYRLSDPRGSVTLTDSSPNGYNGTYQNNVRLGRSSPLDCENPPSPGGGFSNGFTNFCETSGDWYGGSTTGSSAFFDGRSNSGAHAYVNGITLPYQAYTLEAWVDPAEISDMAILQHGGGGALYIKGNDFVFDPSSNLSSPLVSSPIPVGAYHGNPHNIGWHLVAGTWDGTTARLYVDGYQVASATGVSGLSSSASTFYIGLANNFGLPTFHGQIADVGYFASALGADEVADQWEIGTYDSYDYSFAWPTASHDETAPLISNFEPYDGAALSTDSSKKPFQFTFSTDDEDDSATSCSGSLSDGSTSQPVTFTASAGVGNAKNWSAPIPDTTGSYALTLTCMDANSNTSTRTYHYTYGHFAEVIAIDSPLAYYRLDEAAGSSTLVDSSGHGYNGEFKNDQNSFSGGISGDSDSSRQFLGAGGYAYVNGIPAPTEGYTLEGWVALQDTANQSIVEHGGAGSVFVREGQFVFRPNANVAVEVDGGSASGCAPVANGDPLGATPTFQEFDAVWDGVYASLYIDGQLCGQIEASLPPFPSGASTLYLGFGSQEPWLRGALDEVSYYSDALSSEQVTYHYLADPPLRAGFAAGAQGPGSSASAATHARAHVRKPKHPHPGKRKHHKHKAKAKHSKHKPKKHTGRKKPHHR